MPHAERDTMGEPVVNGENPHSQFISVSIFMRYSDNSILPPRTTDFN